MAGIRLEGNTSGNVAEVTAQNELNVALTQNHDFAGHVVVVGENHDGEAGFTQKVRRPIRVSTDGRLRTGIDTSHWDDTFNHAVVDVSAYQAVTATATLAQTGGYLIFNSGNSLASGAVARVQTYKTFRMMGGAALEVGFRVRFASNAATNSVAEFGLGFAATTATPTDGVYFKLNTTGQLVGVININGTETTSTSSLVNVTANTVYACRIIIDQDRAEFYVDGVLRDVITSPATSPTISFARALPLLMRYYNAAALTTTQRLEVSDVYVFTRDINTVKPVEAQAAGQLLNSAIVPRGTAAGQTANFTNSTAPVSATLANATAGYTTLGGKFQFAAVAGAATDYALFAYQVPVAAAAGGNKNLVVTGVKIDTYNTGAAVATTGTVLEWGLGVGSTAVSLATADSATAGTRAPRRIPLGVQSFAVGAAIGAGAEPINVPFAAPLYAEAGTFVHIILQMPVGTATASQVIRGTVLINGYFE